VSNSASITSPRGIGEWVSNADLGHPSHVTSYATPHPTPWNRSSSRNPQPALRRRLDDLCSALAELDPSASPNQVCDALLEKMLTDDPEDDVAVLALRIDL
jgi:hypothetical protein